MSHAPDATEPDVPSQPPALALSGDYILREEIGRGAMGTVFRAELRRPAHGLPAGAEVAIKFLRRELADDPAAAERLRREGELGMRIDSPFIARIHGVLHEQVLGLSVVGLVMELVRGPTLRRFLRERAPAVDDLVRRIGADAAQGLRALHEDGLVHRDIKPENMALTPEGRVKLMDLGLAWAANARPGSSGFFGSIAYAAPEVLRNRPAGPAADLYALGVVLYEVLTGVHPFADVLDDPDQLLAAHLEREPRRPAHVNPRASPFLEAVVLDLLRKEPELRGFDAAQLAQTLAEGVRSEYWQERVRQAPVEAAQRRLRAIRRFAPTPFFGRRAELAQLHRRLHGVLRSGRGAAVRVTGPEGIGRRRLLDEWIDQALAEHGARVEFVAGRGDLDPAHPRGAPFPALLRELLLDGEQPDAPNAAARLADRLRAIAPDLAPLAEQIAGVALDAPSPLPPEARADLLLRGLLAAAGAGGEDRVLLVRIDRADQLDTTAQAVVDRLLARVTEHPVLLVLVMHLRHAHVPFPYHDLVVKGLDRDAFVAFGRALFAPDHAPADERLQAAHAMFGGSPGALLEALDALAQQGLIGGRPGGLLGLPDEIEIRPAPPLLARVRQRARELSAEQREVLQAAAVLGERFPLADLVALTGQPELQVLGSLSVFQGRVVRANGDEVAFRHRDFRMALLDLVPRPVRHALHRRAARVLAARGAPALAVGMHHSRGMEHEAAVEPLLEGLEILVRGGSRRAAGRVLARLRVHLATLGEGPATRRHAVRMHELAAASALRSHDLDAAAAAGQQMLHAASAAGDHAARARALLLLAEVAALRDQTLAALSTLDAAEAAAAEAEEPAALRAAVGIARTELHLELGDTDTALQAIAQAREALGDAARDHAALHAVEARVQLVRGHFARARKSATAAAELAQAAGDAAWEARARAVLSATCAALGDHERAARHLHEVEELVQRAAAPRAVARATLALGEALAWRGDVVDARAHLLAALSQAHAASDFGTRDVAALWLRLLGIPVPRVPGDELPTSHPVVRALRCLAEAKEARQRRDEANAMRHLENALDVERSLDLPVHVRLLVLRAAGYPGRADELANDIAQRLPITQRRRFLRLAAGAARLVPPG